ncbi:kinetochore component CENP-S-domain-containing protein [Kalaharituber pfeilii]|nr:kinetochore component CENP-S-domain-containing protein [Kalaharituber pfeilii]
MGEPDEDLRERLKAALWHTIGKIVDEEALELDVVANQAFIAALTEMVWTQLENVTRDLESFAKHAGRSTIVTDDVLLLVRRNEELVILMKDFIEKEKEKRGAEVSGKRK